jgi:hypothetical protein
MPEETEVKTKFQNIRNCLERIEIEVKECKAILRGKKLVLVEDV